MISSSAPCKPIRPQPQRSTISPSATAGSPLPCTLSPWPAASAPPYEPSAPSTAPTLTRSRITTARTVTPPSTGRCGTARKARSIRKFFGCWRVFIYTLERAAPSTLFAWRSCTVRGLTPSRFWPICGRTTGGRGRGFFTWQSNIRRPSKRAAPCWTRSLTRSRRGTKRNARRCTPRSSTGRGKTWWRSSSRRQRQTSAATEAKS
mmetsp:Transcript_40730/g.75402  ORF Transcript_40730/g.75402 Transcript_40730/m.75402 type:complete len:205 (+) Transcript_40730:418-1032(+)